MFKSINISTVLLIGTVFTQNAWATDNDYKFYARVGGSFLSLSGDVSKENSGGAFSPEVDFFFKRIRYRDLRPRLKRAV